MKQKILLTLCLILLGAGPSLAQKPTVSNYFDYDRAWRADPLYDSAVQQSQSMPHAFSFYTLRLYYMQGSHYDPVGEEPQKELFSAAERALQAKDPTQLYDALDTARSVLWNHAANLAVVEMGETLSKRDKRLGKPEYYAWLRKGLMTEVMNSGDGSSPETAYDVITLEEERELLDRLNLKITRSETVQEENEWYNMYEITKPDGTPSIIFVNATYPLSKVKKMTGRGPAPEIGDFRQ